MKIATLKNKTLVFTHWSYFLASAENVTLGSYGEKKTPIGKPNYFLKHRDFDLSGAEISSVEEIKLDVTKTKKGDFHLAADAKVAGGNVGVSYDNFKEGKLVLMKFGISLGEVKDCFNSTAEKSKKAIQELKGMKKPRIVNQVFVIVSAEFARNISTSAEFKIKSTIKGIDIEPGIKHTGETNVKISISPGTVFAYGLLEPVFKKPKATATEIEKFTPDQFGIG
jgi:hypothetical protein